MKVMVAGWPKDETRMRSVLGPALFDNMPKDDRTGGEDRICEACEEPCVIGPKQMAAIEEVQKQDLGYAVLCMLCCVLMGQLMEHMGTELTITSDVNDLRDMT